MNRATRLGPLALGLAIGALALSAHAGTSLQWTTAYYIAAESAGDSDSTDFGKGGTTSFGQPYDFTSKESDIEFFLSAYGEDAGPGIIDRYNMRAGTQNGWISDQFSTMFQFEVGSSDVVMQYAEAGYFGAKTFLPPTMSISSGGSKLTTLSNIGETFALQAGGYYTVDIRWAEAPMIAGDYAEASFTISPTAIPGSGALALLGYGAVIRRRRRKD